VTKNSSGAPTEVREGPTHPDPYAYYASLVAERPLFRDEAHGFWVAASAAAVKAVLESPLCLTRPRVGRIPALVEAGPMSRIYGRLVRLRDDEPGRVLKAAMVRAFRKIDLAEAAAIADRWARTLDDEIGPERGNDRLARFAGAMPLATMASLLGVADERCADIATALSAYVTAVAAAATGFPAPTDALIAEGHEAADRLLSLMKGVIDRPVRAPLLDAWLGEARAAGCAEEDIAANAVGFLIQAYPAAAAAIGLTLLALARKPDARIAAQADRKSLRPLVAEVMRCDPITHSTIRFLAADGTIGGQAMRAGDMIIVMLGAAGLDPALNDDAQSFVIDRAQRRALDFGAGAHACPADRLAPLIVEIAVHHLLARGVAFDRLEAGLAYAPSAHIRIPIFRA